MGLFCPDILRGESGVIIRLYVEFYTKKHSGHTQNNITLDAGILRIDIFLN